MRDNEAMTELPRPPSGLRKPGRALWDSVAEFEFTGGELEILRQLVCTVDEADKWERELRTLPALVPGSVPGTVRPNPIARMLQDHRLLIRRLVDSLNIPYAEEEIGRTANQRHAAKAANARWRNAREVS